MMSSNQSLALFKVDISNSQSTELGTTIVSNESDKTISNKSYNSTQTADVNDINDEQAIALIEKMQKSEQQNKETLKRLRTLNEKVTKKFNVVRTELKTIIQENQKLKKENQDVEQQMKDVINELKDMQEQMTVEDERQVDFGTKIYNKKGKLKKDELTAAMKDMLNFLETTSIADQQNVDKKENECNEMEQKLDRQNKDYEDKLEQQSQLLDNAVRYRKVLKVLETDVKEWVKDFYSTTRLKSTQMSVQVRDAFVAAMQRISEIIEECNKGNKELTELLDHLKDAEKRLSKFDPSDEVVKLKEEIDEMPSKFSDKLRDVVDNREKAIPSQAGESTDEYLKVLYDWSNNERNEFDAKLKAAANETNQMVKKMAINDEKRAKEMSELDAVLSSLDSEEASLMNENYKIQTDIDDRNAQEFVGAKKKTHALAKILHETTIYLQNRQREMSKKQKEAEDAIESEETEGRVNEVALEYLRRKKIRLEDELERLERQIEDIHNQMRNRKAQRDEEHQDLINELERLKSCENELTQKIREAKVVIKEIEILEAELDEANKRCEAKENEMCEKEEAFQRKFEANQRLESDCMAVNDECQSIQNKLKEVEKLNKVKQNRIIRDERTLLEIKCDLEEEESKSMAVEQQPRKEPQPSSERMQQELNQQQQRESECAIAEHERPKSERQQKNVIDEQRQHIEIQNQVESEVANEKPQTKSYDIKGEELIVEFKTRIPMLVQTIGKAIQLTEPVTNAKQIEAAIAPEPRRKLRKHGQPIPKIVEFVQGEMKKMADIGNVSSDNEAKPQKELQVEEPQIREVPNYLNKPSSFQKRSDAGFIERVGEKSPASKEAKKKNQMEELG